MGNQATLFFLNIYFFMYGYPPLKKKKKNNKIEIPKDPKKYNSREVGAPPPPELPIDVGSKDPKNI
jgi:hypothetical protein